MSSAPASRFTVLLYSGRVSAASILHPTPLVFETEWTVEGVRLPLRLGAESYGALSPVRDNAVLVCHHYTGTMHAAGRHTESPRETPGWWDALIGPGRALDTERFYVVCLNTPSNVQVKDPRVVTAGPDTPAPDGQPWGARFPAWTLADLFGLQRELMRRLGLRRWHAVVGPSLGGIQALQWAARAPELAPRVAAIACSVRAGVAITGAFVPLLRASAAQGGVPEALRVISTFGLGSDGLHAWFRDADFGAYLQGRSAYASLAHILDIARVVSGHDLAGIAPWPELFGRWREHGLELLTANAKGDLFFPAAEMRDFAAQSGRAGVHHRHLEFESEIGHLACVYEPQHFATELRHLLEP